jgi:guanosine-3',5'-bis(diphosphate) 3'-pyrophosphohydrolase
VFGREKSPYSIWRKLQRKSIGFSQMSDIYAFRVIVDSEEDCYRALGVVHRAWSSVPDRFKDYISTPKRNNYRSLHTTVVGPRGMRIEMQIRTESMDRVNEEGVAAHFRYKDASYGLDLEGMEAAGGRDPLANLRQLVQVLEHGGDSEELVEHAKLEMFLDQVFVFTPKGKLVSLPRGAMPLDFAYAVHTSVGDTCIGVKINGELKPLRTPLVNGDVVEVVRGSKPVVPPDWRSLTVTGRARSAIRRHIRQTEKEEFLRLGRSSLEQVFERAGKKLKDVSLRPILERFALESDETLFDAVGRGRVSPSQVLETAYPGMKDSDREAATARRKIEGGQNATLYVRGGGLTPGVSLHFAHCCSPVPGDRIVGILREDGANNQEGGLDVHTIDCPRLAEYEDREELWRDLNWTPEAERSTISLTRLHATIQNAPGVLGLVCTIIGEAGGNIVNLRMHHRQSDFFDTDIDVEVRDAKHLTNIQAALAGLSVGRDGRSDAGLDERPQQGRPGTGRGVRVDRAGERLRARRGSLAAPVRTGRGRRGSGSGRHGRDRPAQRRHHDPVRPGRRPAGGAAGRQAQPRRRADRRGAALAGLPHRAGLRLDRRPRQVRPAQAEPTSQELTLERALIRRAGLGHLAIGRRVFGPWPLLASVVTGQRVWLAPCCTFSMPKASPSSA